MVWLAFHTKRSRDSIVRKFATLLNNASMEDGLALLIPSKSYNKFGLLCLAAFVSIGVVLIGAASDFDSKATLQCNPDKTLASDLSTRKFIEAQCLLKYAKIFHPSLPLQTLLMINFGLVYLFSIIYAYWVNDRVEIFVDSPSATTNGVEDNRAPLSSISPAASDPKACRQSNRFSVFMVYNMHLIFCRIIPLVVFAIFFLTSSNFPVQYDCPWPIKTTNSPLDNFLGRPSMNRSASVDCIYPMGSKMGKLAFAVVATNFFTGTVAFIELAYLLWLSWKDSNLLTDLEFCSVYLLRKRKRIRKLIKMIRDNISDGIFYLHDDFGEKHLSRRKLEEMYINVIIQQGRDSTWASRSKSKGRHEILETHFKIPEGVITLTTTTDLFELILKDKLKTILVVGPPGIGKTFFTKKIFYQWQQQALEFWHDKIVMLIRFRNFSETMGKTTFREVLRLSDGLNNMSDADFNHIYEYICLFPNNLILIFDGLDELKINEKSSTETQTINSQNEVLHIFQILKQLVEGELLREVTVLITSRPTAEQVYNQLAFSLNLEILGFHEEQIEKYVQNFCCRDDHKSSEIWHLIRESPELLSLCYIPVNSYIVCLTLVESIEAEGQRNIPKTITELYKRAIKILLYRHHSKYKMKNNEDRPKDYFIANLPHDLQKDLNKLQKIAMNGMTNEELIFNFSTDDKLPNGLADCGLFNKLEHKTNNIFCFLHLTIQEFLAALHVVDDINNVQPFLSAHIDNPRWHLVIQFVFGLVGDKMRELEKERNVLKR